MVICDISMYPRPPNTPDTVNIILGPILSFKVPVMIAPDPITKKATEDAPDIKALDQPNSCCSSLKKTPYVNIAPMHTAWMKKLAATILYP